MSNQEKNEIHTTQYISTRNIQLLKRNLLARYAIIYSDEDSHHDPIRILGRKLQ